jgi:AcrR family transcriptional regulator
MAEGREAATRRRILDRARDRFFKEGYTKVTVDELAGSLAMSKKTLYRHFPSKEAIFTAVIEDAIKEVAGEVDLVLKDEAIDTGVRLKALFEVMRSRFAEIGGPLVEDVKVRFPELFRQIQGVRRRMIEQELGGIIDRGIREGVFREDLDRDVFILMYENSVTGILNPEVLSRLPLAAEEAFEAIVTVLFEGALAVDAGKKGPVQPGTRRRPENDEQ